MARRARSENPHRTHSHPAREPGSTRGPADRTTVSIKSAFPPAGDEPTLPYVIALILIILATLLLQSEGFTHDLLEAVHGWRQAQTAMTSRNFVRDGMNPLVARVDYMGDGQMQLEFPLYQYIVAVGYCVFGIHDVFGRIVADAFAIGSAIFLFLIGRLVWNNRVGLLAAAMFSLAPLNIFFNRAFLPDSSTICLCLAAVWAFLRYFRDGRTMHLVIAGIAITLATAGKPPIAVSVAPLLCVALILSHGWRFWRQRNLCVTLAISLALVIAWLKYSGYVNNNKSDDLGISFTNAGMHSDEMFDWYFGTWGQRSTSLTYKKIALRAVEWTGHWAILPLALIGPWLPRRCRMQWILPAWFLGALAYVLIFFNVNIVHNYYQMPIVPMLAMGYAVSADRVLSLIGRLFGGGLPLTRGGSLARVAGAVALCGIQVYLGYDILWNYDPHAQERRPGQKAYWEVRTPFVELGDAIHAKMPDVPGLTALVGASMVSDVRDPRLLYHIDRRGFIIHVPDDVNNQIKFARLNGIEQRRRRFAWIDQHLFEMIDRAKNKGVTSLVIVTPSMVLSPQTRSTLASRFRLHHEDPKGQFSIYLLNS